MILKHNQPTLFISDYSYLFINFFTCVYPPTFFFFFFFFFFAFYFHSLFLLLWYHPVISAQTNINLMIMIIIYFNKASKRPLCSDVYPDLIKQTKSIDLLIGNRSWHRDIQDWFSHGRTHVYIDGHLRVSI